MARKTFSGQYGIVLFFDSSINGIAQDLNHGFNTEQNIVGECIDLVNKHSPHLNLYHARFGALPFSLVRIVVSEIYDRLPFSIHFLKLSVYGENFLFWDVLKNFIAPLRPLHNRATTLVRFMDPTGEKQVEKEGLTISESKERENLLLWGHPLVNNEFRPHITVGYKRDGIDGYLKTHKHCRGKITGVAFAEIGELGTIKEIVYQKQC